MLSGCLLWHALSKTKFCLETLLHEKEFKNLQTSRVKVHHKLKKQGLHVAVWISLSNIQSSCKPTVDGDEKPT